jgi:hypothetical protein
MVTPYDIASSLHSSGKVSQTLSYSQELDRYVSAVQGGDTKPFI